MKPEHIQERTFSKAFRGFNPAEVQEFLGQLAGDVRGLSAENAILRLEVAKLESSLRASQELESKLKRMLEKMESTSETLIGQSKSNAAALATQAEHDRIVARKNASDEAMLIVRDAERRAQAVIEEANRRKQLMLEEIGMLHSRKATLVARIKALLQSQIEFLKAMETDVRDPVRETVSLPKGIKTKEGLGAAELQAIMDKLDEFSEDRK